MRSVIQGLKTFTTEFFRTDKPYESPADPSIAKEGEIIDPHHPLIAPRPCLKPIVRIPSPVMKRIGDSVNRFIQMHPNVETGFAFVGTITYLNGETDYECTPNEDDEHNEGKRTYDHWQRKRQFDIIDILKAGPNAIFSPGMVKFDRPWQQNELNKIQLIYPNAGHIGDVHLHPGSMSQCSQGDLSTDSQNVIESHSKEMIFAIINQPGFLCKKPQTYGLNFTFYYMGFPTGYEYELITPDIHEEAHSPIPLELNQYWYRNYSRASMDLQCIKSLEFFDEPSMSVRKNQLVLCIDHVTGYKVMIAFDPDLQSAPDILMEKNNEFISYEPDFQWNPMIWFTQILLEIEKRLFKITQRSSNDYREQRNSQFQKNHWATGGRTQKDVRRGHQNRRRHQIRQNEWSGEGGNPS